MDSSFEQSLMFAGRNYGLVRRISLRRLVDEGVSRLMADSIFSS